MLGMSYTSCSLNLLPGIECPLCRNRLYRTFPKKSTPFSKKFPEFPGVSFQRAGAVKGEFSTIPSRHEKMHERGETGGSCHGLLCKQMKGSGNFSTGVGSCGQLLWRSVWRMWKTMSFQQLLALLPCGWIGGKLAPAPRFSTGARGMVSDYVTVCIQKFPKKKASSVGICRSLPGVGRGSEPPPSDKLCEKPPKPPFLLPFPPGVSISRFGKY